MVGQKKSNLSFRVMALEFRVRDMFRPCKVIVKEVGIEEGFHFGAKFVDDAVSIQASARAASTFFYID